MSLSKLIKEISEEPKPKIISPIIDNFLITQKNIVVNDKNIQSKLIDIVSDDSNSKRTGRFGASSRGLCTRRQVFDYTGDVEKRDDIDITLQNLFNDGVWRHIRWQMMGLLSGALTDVETKVSNEKYPNFGGSIDGIGISDKYGKYGFELKGTSWMPSEVKETHLKQIHTYFILDPDIKVFSVIYEDKRTQDWLEFLVFPDPSILASVKSEMLSLEESAEFKVYPEIKPDCRLRQGKEYQMCPYRNSCLEWHEN